VIEAGTVHDLTGVKASDLNGNDVKLAGRYELVEFSPVEPSAYVWSDSWTILHEADSGDEFWEDKILFVDAYNVMEKLDPEGYASLMEQERMMEQETT
jgi:hypothetical protein